MSIAACAVATCVVIVPGPAQADDGGDPSAGDHSVAVNQTFTSSEIAQAVEQGQIREEQGDESLAEERLEDRLIDASAEQGAPLTDADVTVLELGDGLVQAAVPATIELTKVSVQGDTATGLSVAAEAQESDEAASILSPGPGMGSWGERVDGQYVLTVRNPTLGPSNVIGTGTFLWARERYVNDGNGTYDWWSYTRKGIGQAADVFGDNWQVADLIVQSYPYDSIEDRLVNWTDLDPAADFSGQCSSHSFSTGVSTPVWNAGYSFTDCDGYDVWHNPNNPGSYKIHMDQGLWVREGSRAAGYSVGWKSKQGTPGSMHDYQKIRFVHTPTSTDFASCDSYEVNKTCEGYGP